MGVTNITFKWGLKMAMHNLKELYETKFGHLQKPKVSSKQNQTVASKVYNLEQFIGRSALLLGW